MLKTVFATKVKMSQAWSKQGKRLAVTRCKVEDNLVVAAAETEVIDHQTHQPRLATIYQIGYGQKKLKAMTKPLRSKLQQSGFSIGAQQLRGLRVFKTTDDQAESADTTDQPQVGAVIKANQVLAIGDVVKVQGVTKGRGFSGVMKRHGFSGGPRTHGQSDRERAPGSIGSGTDPGRVWPGKKMAGHYGVETQTVSGLVVVHLNSQTGEVWLSGPVPGHANSIVSITKTGQTKTIELDEVASGIEVVQPTEEK